MRELVFRKELACSVRPGYRFVPDGGAGGGGGGGGLMMLGGFFDMPLWTTLVGGGVGSLAIVMLLVGLVFRKELYHLDVFGRDQDPVDGGLSLCLFGA